MSSFEVKVRKITIEPHPDADLIEIGKVDDYQVVVGKDQFKTGDLVVYIPEAAIVPIWLIEHMGLVGRLAGSNHNRVKAIKLRQILSQGLCLPVNKNIAARGIGNDFNIVRPITQCGGDILNVVEGDDVAEFLGIYKWEPPIPVHMAGEVCNLYGKTLSYDIENIKKYPNVLVDGEEVEFTEKLHGTWACFGQYPNYHHPELFEGNTIVTSKGLSGQGLAFKFNDANANNLYVKAFYENFVDGWDEAPLLAVIRELLVRYKFISAEDKDRLPFYILCEVFGSGVQDLIYGLKKPEIRVFDIYIGFPGTGYYLDPADRDLIASTVYLKSVPVLYTGPFNKEVLMEYTNGTETISGKNTHMREGVVITPLEGRRDPFIGRVKLKSVSAAYLLRKNKNATEFQ